MPFCNLSRIIPKSEIQRWCNLEFDILEISAGGYIPENLRRVVNSALYDMGAETLYTRLYRPRAIEAVVRCRCTKENSTIAILEKKKAIPIMPVTYKDGLELVKLVTYTWSDLKLAIKALSEVSKVEILNRRKIFARGVFAMTVPIKEILGSLTLKQLDSLMKAIESGYYEIPSRTTIEALAKRLGIPRSTFEEHLRKAEVKVIKAMMPYIRLVRLAESS